MWVAESWGRGLYSLGRGDAQHRMHSDERTATLQQLEVWNCAEYFVNNNLWQMNALRNVSMSFACSGQHTGTHSTSTSKDSSGFSSSSKHVDNKGLVLAPGERKLRALSEQDDERLGVCKKDSL